MATNIRNTENSFTDVALLDTTLNMVLWPVPPYT